VFNVVYQQIIATVCMYDSGYQICCNWSRLKPGLKLPAHRSTMPQVNIITTPSSFFNRQWVN